MHKHLVWVKFLGYLYLVTNFYDVAGKGNSKYRHEFFKTSNLIKPKV